MHGKHGYVKLTLVINLPENWTFSLPFLNLRRCLTSRKTVKWDRHCFPESFLLSLPFLPSCLHATLVCPGCHNKTLQADWLKQQKLIFRISGGWKSKLLSSLTSLGGGGWGCSHWLIDSCLPVVLFSSYVSTPLIYLPFLLSHVELRAHPYNLT